MSTADKIEQVILKAAGIGVAFWAILAAREAAKRKATADYYAEKEKGANGIGGYGKALREIYDNLNAGYFYGDWRRYPSGERYFRMMLWTSDDDKYIYWENYGRSAHRNKISELKWIIENIFDTTAEQFLEDYPKARWENHREIVYYNSGKTEIAEDYSDPETQRLFRMYEHLSQFNEQRY